VGFSSPQGGIHGKSLLVALQVLFRTAALSGSNLK
jgi:hypothetical protein